MKWKRRSMEVFQDQLKLHILFFGIAVGRVKWKKWGDHQKKKTACTFVGEILIWGKSRPVFKKRIFLKWKTDAWGGFSESIEMMLIFWGYLESSNAKRGPCENNVRLSMYEGHMEFVEHTLHWIFGAYLIKSCTKTVEFYSICLTLRWVKTKTKWCNWVITTLHS